MNNKDKKKINGIANELRDWVDANDKRAIFCVLGDGTHRLDLIGGTGHEIIGCLCDLMKGEPKIKNLLKVAIFKAEIT